MTDSRQQVRGAARAATGNEPSGPVILLPRRRPGYLGPVHIMQLLLAETAIIAILATLTRGIVAITAACAGATVLLLVTLGRRNGRWWVERRMMIWRYNRRRRASPARYSSDPRLAALSVLAPGLTVEDIPAADGTRVGVAQDDAGWFAVAARSTGAAMCDDPGERLPLEVLATALADANQPGAVLQVVRHTVPAPGLDTHPASPADQSYRQLLAEFGAAPVPLDAIPLDAVTWIAVRLDRRALAEAGADIGTDRDAAPAPAVVAALLRGAAKSLRRVGIPCQVLDAAGLVDALARSCDLDLTAPGSAPAARREKWTTWHSARLAHRCFWIRSWPPVEEAAALLDRLAATPAAVTNVTMIMVPDNDNDLIDLRGLVRVAAPAADLDRICQTITDLAVQAHAELFPLDGEQAPAVYASAPTGGGVR
ncbi:Otogelin [Candidatus Protofrankia californiensis]|uniref:Otogelin n=1 Tax=Candidatus Protofrankia californiensis TaxID=1839754 RepID=A0A1C3NWV4_9ACTN|nr:Otogelin [Candidatus Protofrankia californiensis]